jgi:hypothetical protein
MLREPQKTEKAVQVRKDKKTGRFQIVRLEARIAPNCRTNPHGRTVGNCGKHGPGY